MAPAAPYIANVAYTISGARPQEPTLVECRSNRLLRNPRPVCCQARTPPRFLSGISPEAYIRVCSRAFSLCAEFQSLFVRRSQGYNRWVSHSQRDRIIRGVPQYSIVSSRTSLTTIPLERETSK